MPPATPTIPHTLPLSNLDWEKLTPFIGAAHRGVARLDALASNANTREAILQLAPLLSIQEALSSSRIEGTQATLEEVLRFQADEKVTGEKRDDILEVINYRNALEFAFKEMEKLPLSARLLKDAHAILLSGARGKQKDPGNFRSIQVYIGPHTPPEARHVPDLFANLEKYIHHEEADALVQLAIVHAQFEIIHPFRDGNGRLGRLLMPLFLYHKKIITTPYFYLSEYLEKNRSEYYDSLNRITADGDWEQWIIFCLRAVAGQSRNSAGKAQKIIDLKEKIASQVQKTTRSQYTLQITGFLCVNPWFSTVQFHNEAGIPRPSAANLLARLENGGIIEKIVPGKGRRTSIYQFPELVRLLQNA